MLTRAFATLIALIAALGLLRTALTEPLYRSADARSEHLLATQSANHRVRTLFDRAQLALDGYLATGDSAFLVPYHAAREEAPAAMADLERSANPDNPEVAEVRERTDEWYRQADELAGAKPGSAGLKDAIAVNQGNYRRAVVASETYDASVTREFVQVFDEYRRLRNLALAMAVMFTLLAVIVATLVGVRTTRRIVRPLDRVIDVLKRFRLGELGSRSSVTDGPAELTALATSVNAMADEVVRARDRYEDERRMYQEVRELGANIRRLTTLAPAAAAAAKGLGEALQADHVVVRLSGQEGRRIGPTVWTAQGAVGDPAELASTPVTWWGNDWASSFVAEEVPTGAGPPPERERAALRRAGAGPVITVGLGEDEDLLGHVTLVRRTGAAPWGPFDVRLVELSVIDLARALINARLFEREQRLVTQLQELNETKAGLMSTVSHELRTPLTSISGYLELLREEEAGPINKAQARMLEIVDRNTTRLLNLIEDLLTVSRIQEGRYSATMVPLDGAAVVAAALHAMEPVAEKADVTLTGDVRGPLPIRGDADQLDRLLINLLSNAVKFTPPGGSAAVTARREGPDVIITVRDTGIGIPAADQQRLFSRFFRATNATDQAIQGTGLGLSIVYAIVDQHGGVITVDSQEGEGSTFTVLLPAIEPAEPEPDRDDQTAGT